MAQTQSQPDDGESVVIKGWMLKMFSRGRGWNDRYFELAGNKLTYYQQQGDARPRGVFLVSQELGCEVGSPYIDQRQKGTRKEVLYCIRLTWHVTDDDSSLRDDGTVVSKAAAAQTPPRVALPGPPASPRGLSEEMAVLPEASDTRLAVTPVRGRRRATSEPEGAKRVGRFRRRSRSRDKSVSGGSVGRRASRRLSGGKGRMAEGSASVPSRIVVPRSDSLDELKTGGKDSRDYHAEERIHEQRMMESEFRENKKVIKKKNRKRVKEGVKYSLAAGAAVTVGVLTAGVGLVAGLVFLGAGAAAGTGMVAGGASLHRNKKKRDEVTIATPSYEEARRWKAALDACLVSEIVVDSTWGQMFVMEGREAASALMPTRANRQQPTGFLSPDGALHGNVMGAAESQQRAFGEPGTRWQPLDSSWANLLGPSSHGLRIYREEHSTKQGDDSFLGLSSPPLKAHVVLNASPVNSFLCLLLLPKLQDESLPMIPNSGQRASFRVIERVNDHMDVIHMIFRPLYLWPSWTAPRDFVLLRYWRHEPDGTYVLCIDSVKHAKCPPQPNFTRGDMHGVYTIAPKKKRKGLNKAQSAFHPECLLTAVVQVDPKGWIPLMSFPLLASRGYGEAFGVAALLQMLDIRDALDFDRFVPVAQDTPRAIPSSLMGALGAPRSPEDSLERSQSIDTVSEHEDDPVNYDFTYSAKESNHASSSQKGISARPKPLPAEKWAEPMANSFRVRGRTYRQDKLKINAGSSIGRLIAVDVVGVDEPLYSGFSVHPTERLQLALERERRAKANGQPSDLPPFVFVVNICLPGPPFYHGVFYYAVDDMSTIDGSDGTPSSILCNKFFFGDSDDFRDKTFKLIPSIVEGNFLVRKAVGSTPAIMGTKLRQMYVRNERFCEVILDCGSSQVATGVIRLSLGYAKTLVVDMGFLFEGASEEVLPERIFGCVRMKRPSFGSHLRKVSKPPAS